MLKIRIIPILLLENNGLVKTKQFKKRTYIGDSINAIKIFNEKEVDELVVLDIDASKKTKEPNFALLKELATECFMPFGYGGGIKKLEHIQKLFSLGIEKVIINSALQEDRKFIEEAIQIYGSQSIVASVDIKKTFFGSYSIYNHVKRKNITKDIKSYIQELEEFGFGEIIVNNIDKDGMMNGYDLTLLKILEDSTRLPIVHAGGAKNLNDIKLAVSEGATSLAAGSMFVFQGEHNAVLISYPKYKELEKISEEYYESK